MHVIEDPALAGCRHQTYEIEKSCQYSVLCTFYHLHESFSSACTPTNALVSLGDLHSDIAQLSRVFGTFADLELVDLRGIMVNSDCC